MVSGSPPEVDGLKKQITYIYTFFTDSDRVVKQGKAKTRTLYQSKTAQEHIQLKLIDLAKEKIFAPHKSVSEIAYDLGFKYPQHFTQLFKKRVGCSPNEYTTQN